MSSQCYCRGVGVVVMMRPRVCDGVVERGVGCPNVHGLGQLVRGLADHDRLDGCRLCSCVDGRLAAYYVSIEWRGLWRLVDELGDCLLGGWRTPLDKEVSVTSVVPSEHVDGCGAEMSL